MNYLTQTEVEYMQGYEGISSVRSCVNKETDLIAEFKKYVRKFTRVTPYIRNLNEGMGFNLSTKKYIELVNILLDWRYIR